MSLLANVKRGKIKQPILAIAYGPDGVGKSTFGADAPNPIFLGTENGTANLDVARFPAPTNYKMVLQAIDELTTSKHDFQTLVIDSLDWLEPLVWEQVCFDGGVKNIEDFGYGKGYVLAIKAWQEMVSKLSKLRETKGMNILLIAHAMVKLAKDPQNQTEYDRYQLKLNEKAAALWREFVDCVLFANFEVLTKSDKQGKTKAFGDGARYLFTERRPGFDAKNRMGLPFQLDLSWEAFKEAVDAGNPEDPELIKASIQELLSEVEDEKLIAKAQEMLSKAGDDSIALEKILNKLRTITAEAA